MLKRADVAMYAAKRAGKATVCAYASELEDADESQLDLRGAFARDLAAGALDVAFQPIHFADGRLSGFEALARWNHEGSAVSPATFLPMARRLDAIGQLDELVMRKATAEATRWGPQHVVSVNVDGATLADPAFPARVAAALASAGLPASRLAVEVLETSLIEHDEPALASLRHLRGMGVHVVVDDFGAGYASLVRLQALNPDVVKIDRSLVAAEPSSATTPLLSGVAELAHRMGAFVVAEGVETESQLSAAIAAGCDAVQGFLLGRPTAAEECAELARQDAAETASGVL
jgi:EAL domain-containing protein (putative c-di-GMP-specific phosphodiesterase class I)